MSDKPGVVAPPPLIYLLPLLTGFLLQYAFPIQFLPYPFNWGIGSSLIVIGIILATWAIKEFHDAGTSKDIRKPTLVIVDKGPYRFTRNPMYLSLTLLYLGIAFFSNTTWIILLLPIPLLIMQQGVVKREEAYLERKFGSKYLAYKRRVRRWI